MNMNKFLCIYHSPYYLSVDNAFSVLHIQNVYIYSKEIRRLVITTGARGNELPPPPFFLTFCLHIYYQ